MKLAVVLVALVYTVSVLGGRFIKERNGSRLPVLPQTGGEVQPRELDVNWTMNWAGAVLSGDYLPFVTGVQLAFVTGVLEVPDITAGSGPSDDGSYHVGAFVGVDGTQRTAPDGEECSLLQTGVNLTVDRDGNVTFGAFTEWYPDGSAPYSDIVTIASGDKIRMNVTLYTNRSGATSIENLSNGQSAKQVYMNSSRSLCGYTADWIFEDYQLANEQVPLANFSNLTFTGASVKTTSGDVDIHDADLYGIQFDGKEWTHCEKGSDSSVWCSYTG